MSRKFDMPMEIYHRSTCMSMTELRHAHERICEMKANKQEIANTNRNNKQWSRAYHESDGQDSLLAGLTAALADGVTLSATDCAEGDDALATGAPRDNLSKSISISSAGVAATTETLPFSEALVAGTLAAREVMVAVI
jgi:hypothetical protein